jgi:hypothetical protein
VCWGITPLPFFLLTFVLTEIFHDPQKKTLVKDITNRMRRFFITFLTALCAATYAFAGERYALVIGISRYVPDQGLADLDGPGPDRDAIVKTLLDDFGYKRQNIVVLSDVAATRAGILAALDNLIARVNQGDYVFFYYSGHGTSPQGQHNLPIDGDTGALFPSDFVGGTPAEVAERLVVGRRDLRPRLLKLDQKATVFAVLDTCFSQNLMKSVRPRGKSRGVALSQVIKTRSGSLENDYQEELKSGTAVPSPYPYQNVAWISAALAGQEAVDIDKDVLRQNKTATVDGLPHGALTNALLKGLSGEADLNHDGVITHAELYDYLQRVSTADTWSHQPAWSANEANKQFPSQPVLGGRTRAITLAPLPPGHSAYVYVQLEGAASALRQQLALPRISVTDQNADLVVRAENGGYRIYERGNISVTENVLSAQDAVARIAVEPDVRLLVNSASASQRARLQIFLYQNGQASHQGVFTEDQTFNLMLESSMPVWALVLDVDVTGVVTVLYPVGEHQDAASSGELLSLGENRVGKPFGVEYIKAFAFDREPVGYQSWAGKQFAAIDPSFKNLLNLTKRATSDTTVRVVSQSKDSL